MQLLYFILLTLFDPLLASDPSISPTSLSSIVASLKPKLFDLDHDPTEDVNIISNTDYTSTIEDFTKRITYFKQYEKSPWVAPEGTKESTWTANGGVIPWISSPPVDITDVEVVYNYKNAPNIVFVMVDDWGWNDFGRRSTYLGWTTPIIDSLSVEGINLENYHTYQTCSPSRGSFLTGRYPIRLGLWEIHDQAELPVEETILAQELQTANYRTYLVGKWHLGVSTYAHVPTRRGFDYFYGYYSSYIDYWTKEYEGFLDLQVNDVLVKEEADIDSKLHTGYLLQSKAEQVIKDHAENHADKPLFLYYALQLVHSPFEAPSIYSKRCAMPVVDDDTVDVDSLYNRCGMNLMLDEVVGNLTCALNQHDMMDNTILIIASDNGGDGTIPGNSYPFKGHKGSFYRGGVSATAIIHSRLIPESARGSSYEGLIHVSDWYPTIMRLATDGQWSSKGRSAKYAIDGVDVWDAMMDGTESPRSEIVHYLNEDDAVYQYKNLKYFTGSADAHTDDPSYIFNKESSSSSQMNTMLSCTSPTLMDTSRATYHSSSIIYDVYRSYSHMMRKIVRVMILLAGIFVGVMLCIVYSAHRLEPTLYVPSTDKSHEHEDEYGHIIHHVATDSTPLMNNRV